MGEEISFISETRQMLYELRLIRLHMEFQVKEQAQEQRWQEYFNSVDKHGTLYRYLDYRARGLP